MRTVTWAVVAVLGLAALGSPLAAQAPNPGTKSVGSAYYQHDNYYEYQEVDGTQSSSAEAEAVAYPANPSDGQCAAQAAVTADGVLHAGSSIQARLAYPERASSTYLRNVVSDGVAYRTVRYRVTSSSPLTTTVRINAAFHLHGTLVIDGFVATGHKAETSVEVTGRVWGSLNDQGGGEMMMASDWPYVFLSDSGGVEQWYFDLNNRTTYGLAAGVTPTIDEDRYSYPINTDLTGTFDAAPDAEVTVQWILATQSLIWEGTVGNLLGDDLFLQSDFMDTGVGTLTAYDPDHPEAVITLTPIVPVPDMVLTALPGELPSDGHYVGGLEILIERDGVGLEGLEGTITVAQTGGTGAVQVGPVYEFGGGFYWANLVGQTKGDVQLTVTESTTGATSNISLVVYTPGEDGRPVANAGPNQTVPPDELGQAEVTLDGSSSHDNEGPIVHWRWFLYDEQIGDGETLDLTLELGYYYFVLVVEDADGNVDIDDVEVEVTDAPPPLEISATLDFDWVYQNTETTTQDRHQSVLTVSILAGGNTRESYVVTLGENHESLTNFTAPELTPVSPGTPATIAIGGGRRDLTTAGNYTLTVTVIGLTSGQQATVDVPLALRLLGDVVADGIVNASDKLEMNKKLNGLANLTGVELRNLDLSGDGAQVNAEDKLAINQVLNGLVVP